MSTQRQRKPVSNPILTSASTSTPPTKNPITSKPVISAIRFKSRFWQVVSFAVCLTALVTYRYVTSGAFHPLSCQLLSIRCPPIRIEGHVAPGFERVQKAFQKNFEEGREVGAAVTIYYKGKLVVDLNGGFKDRNSRDPYNADTLQFVYSSTKVLTLIVVARLVDQGLLNYDEKISTYWPEFAQGNKENVTLGDLTQHRAGVSWLDFSLKYSDLGELDNLAALLAQQPHNFNGKAQRSYHGVAGGWYINEIVRRVDPRGRTVGQIVREEIEPTYGVEYHLSVTDDAVRSRMSPMYMYPVIRLFSKLFIPKFINPYKMPKMMEDHMMELMFNSGSPAHKMYVFSAADWSREYDLIKHEIPFVNGVTNTRSMAKLAAMMAAGGTALNPSEPRLLSPEGYALATARLPIEEDYMFRVPFEPSRGGWTFLKIEGMEDFDFLGWGGSGGSLFFWNREHEIGFAYAMNAFSVGVIGEHRTFTILLALKDVILGK